MKFLTTPELAAQLRLHPTTLMIWRTKGRGPAWRKIGKRVLYDEQQVRAWLDSNERHSTREKGE